MGWSYMLHKRILEWRPLLGKLSVGRAFGPMAERLAQYYRRRLDAKRNRPDLFCALGK